MTPPQQLTALAKAASLKLDETGNHIGLDFDPDRDGTAGQVISFGRDEDQKQLKANSFDEFWRHFAKSLNAAKWNGDYLDWDDT